MNCSDTKFYCVQPSLTNTMTTPPSFSLESYNTPRIYNRDLVILDKIPELFAYPVVFGKLDKFQKTLIKI